MRSADWFSGSNYRRARGQRENHANTQSALLWGRGPEAFGPRWREAAKATGWRGQRAQAPPRRSPQRRLSLGERGETSTRFRSTKFQLRNQYAPCPDRRSDGAHSPSAGELTRQRSGHGLAGSQATRPIPTRREAERFLQRRWNGRARRDVASIFIVNAMLFMTTRITFMTYISSLTGIRRLAFEHSIRTTQGALRDIDVLDDHALLAPRSIVLQGRHLRSERRVSLLKAFPGNDGPNLPDQSTPPGAAGFGDGFEPLGEALEGGDCLRDLRRLSAALRARCAALSVAAKLRPPRNRGFEPALTGHRRASSSNSHACTAWPDAWPRRLRRA
jgi:hypothetical protein